MSSLSKITSPLRRCVLIMALISMATALCTVPAYAYIDPGSAGLGLQAVVGAVAGGVVTLKLYSHRIKKFFVRGHRSDAEVNSVEPLDKRVERRRGSL